MLLLGDLRQAAGLLKQLAIDADAAMSLECAARPWRCDDSILRALALHELLSGDAQRSERLAAKWAVRARMDGRVPSLISALMLQALALDAQEKSTEAFASAREAMALAAETGAVQAILDLPTVHLRGLLERARNADERLAQLAQPVLARLRSPGPESGIDAPYSGALSEREILVLRGLQRGESNKVIARSLCISENTVKFHAKNVFRKLGISGRRDVRTGKPADRHSRRNVPAGS
jgi:ATP/maltotriose-dependent transcriptional regulator MalT